MRLTRIQQMLLNANQLPSDFNQSQGFRKITSSSETVRQEIKHKISAMIQRLTGQNLESDEDQWAGILEFDAVLQKDCNEKIERWHRKMQLSNKKGQDKINSTVTAQVQFLIDSHHSRLLKKTQVPPSDAIFLGFIKEDQVFNDRELYLSQMKDWGGLAEIPKGMSELDLIVEIRKAQKRSKKLARTVDTKASKGRKLRFTVHNKLVNFMTPIQGGEPQDYKLLDSLFGVERQTPQASQRHIEEEAKILSTSGVTLI